MMADDLSLHRVLKASPEKVYRAFTKVNALATWIHTYGFICTVQEINQWVGGTYKLSFYNFSIGSSQSFGVKDIDIKFHYNKKAKTKCVGFL